MTKPSTALVVAALAAALPCHGLAQDGETTRGPVVSGTVVERETGTPVGTAAVRLVPEGSEEGILRMTEADGSFRMPPLTPGPYRLLVERIGYADLDRAVELAAGSEAVIRIELVPDAVELEPFVVIETRRSWPGMQGFDERRRNGFGSFFTRQDIEQQNPVRVTELIGRVPGVQVRAMADRWGNAVLMREGCHPLFVLDGMRIVDVQDYGGLDELILPHQVEAVEVYRGLDTPVEFGPTTCGAVVVWTRRSDGGSPLSWKRLLAGAAIALGIFQLAR